MDVYGEKAVRHFRNVLKRKQKRLFSDSQITAKAEKCAKKDTEKGKEQCLTIENETKGQTSEPQPGPSRVQVPRKENGNEWTLPAVLLEDDNDSESSSPPI